VEVRTAHTPMEVFSARSADAATVTRRLVMSSTQLEYVIMTCPPRYHCVRLAQGDPKFAADRFAGSPLGSALHVRTAMIALRSMEVRMLRFWMTLMPITRVISLNMAPSTRASRGNCGCTRATVKDTGGEVVVAGADRVISKMPSGWDMGVPLRTGVASENMRPGPSRKCDVALRLPPGETLRMPWLYKPGGGLEGLSSSASKRKFSAIYAQAAPRACSHEASATIVV
jgi:hypothetical protein